MNIDGTFLENDITAENLSRLAKAESEMYEQRICELSWLAESAAKTVLEMLDSGYDIYEVLFDLSEVMNECGAEAIHEDHLPENLSRLKMHLRFVNAGDKTVFSELLVDALSKNGCLLSENTFLSEDGGNSIVAYVKNPLADEAYDVFSQELSSPRLRYSASLLEAAKLVSRGDTEYALLPLEEKGGARLASVLEILFKEDLKINSVTPVFGYEGNADMKYALVSRHYSIPTCEAEDDRYLEIRIKADSSIPLSELFYASDALGASVYRVNTISFSTDDGETPYYSIVFRSEADSFTSLLLYLTLFSGAYTTVGLYKNLE